jgi:hypothetical protein
MEFLMMLASYLEYRASNRLPPFCHFSPDIDIARYY